MCAVVIDATLVWTDKRDDGGPQMPTKEGRGKTVIWLHRFQLHRFRLCLQLLFLNISSFISRRMHNIAVITKVTKPKKGQLTISPLFLIF